MRRRVHGWYSSVIPEGDLFLTRYRIRLKNDPELGQVLLELEAHCLTKTIGRTIENARIDRLAS